MIPAASGTVPALQSVRTATYDDIPALIALGRDMHLESHCRELEYSETKVERLLALLIDQGTVFVAEVQLPPSRWLVGFIVGMESSPWWSDAPYVSSLALYIMPAMRGSALAVALVRSLEGWAFEHGARQLLLGIHTGVDEERTAKLFERLGFTHYGSDYRKSLTSPE